MGYFVAQAAKYPITIAYIAANNKVNHGDREIFGDGKVRQLNRVLFKHRGEVKDFLRSH